jgi:hypothetical protein
MRPVDWLKSFIETDDISVKDVIRLHPQIFVFRPNDRDNPPNMDKTVFDRLYRCTGMNKFQGFGLKFDYIIIDGRNG